MNKNTLDIIIVGGGPIGLLSLIRGCNAQLNGLLFESRDTLGGQLTELYPKKEIVDIPGIPMILAEDYIKKLELAYYQTSQSIKIKLQESVKKIETMDDIIFVTTNIGVYPCKHLVIATGLGVYTPRTMGILEEENFDHILYSVKDYQFLSGKRVVIMGGGDSAIDWAKMMSYVSDDVSLVHRRREFRGDIETIAHIDKIHILTPYIPLELIGNDNHLEGIVIQHVENGEVIRLPADYIFVNYGNIPLSDTFGFEKLGMGIKVDDRYHVIGNHIYAIGDIASYPNKKKRIAPAMVEIDSVMQEIIDNCKN